MHINLALWGIHFPCSTLLNTAVIHFVFIFVFPVLRVETCKNTARIVKNYTSMESTDYGLKFVFLFCTFQ